MLIVTFYDSEFFLTKFATSKQEGNILQVASIKKGLRAFAVSAFGLSCRRRFPEGVAVVAKKRVSDVAVGKRYINNNNRCVISKPGTPMKDML